jgi:hypothetical protein
MLLEVGQRWCVVEEGVRRPTQRELFVVVEKLYSIYHREKNSASLREGEKERQRGKIDVAWSLSLVVRVCRGLCEISRKERRKERREFREKVGERKF